MARGHWPAVSGGRGWLTTPAGKRSPPFGGSSPRGSLARSPGTPGISRWPRTSPRRPWLRHWSTWPRDGVPGNPAGWLLTVGRRRAIDAFRRRAALDEKYAALARDLGEGGATSGRPLAGPAQDGADLLWDPDRRSGSHSKSALQAPARRADAPRWCRPSPRSPARAASSRRGAAAERVDRAAAPDGEQPSGGVAGHAVGVARSGQSLSQGLLGDVLGQRDDLCVPGERAHDRADSMRQTAATDSRPAWSVIPASPVGASPRSSPAGRWPHAMPAPS